MDGTLSLEEKIKSAKQLTAGLEEARITANILVDEVTSNNQKIE